MAALATDKVPTIRLSDIEAMMPIVHSGNYEWKVAEEFSLIAYRSFTKAGVRAFPIDETHVPSAWMRERLAALLSESREEDDDSSLAYLSTYSVENEGNFSCPRCGDSGWVDDPGPNEGCSEFFSGDVPCGCGAARERRS